MERGQESLQRDCPVQRFRALEEPRTSQALQEPGKGEHKGSPWDMLVAWARLLVLGIESSRWSWQMFRRWDRKGLDGEGDGKVQNHPGFSGMSRWVHFGGDD